MAKDKGQIADHEVHSHLHLDLDGETQMIERNLCMKGASSIFKIVPF